MNKFPNSLNGKRKNRWLEEEKDDSSLEDVSLEEQEEAEFAELKGLLKELLETCRKLNSHLMTQLASMMQTG